jgi:hypothetical protein
MTQQVCDRTGCKGVAINSFRALRNFSGGEPMRVAGWHSRAGGRFTQALLGWTLATMIVLAAVFGPPLAGQSIPGLVELRHEVLMIDREFERWTIGTNTSSGEQAQLAEASRDG